MRESTRYIRQHLREAWDVGKLQWRSFCISLAVVVIVYLISLFLKPSWLSWVALLPGSLLILYIALVRLNAIGPENMGLVWQVRKIGLIVVCIGVVALLGAPFTYLPTMPTWRAVVLTNGTAIVLSTTPELTPFWRYWSGDWKEDEPPLSPLARFLFWIERVRGKS